jgi:hypothetical protein
MLAVTSGGNVIPVQLLKKELKFPKQKHKKQYRIRENLNCYVIYLGKCSRCNWQYVGKISREFRRRHSEHKQEIKNKYGGLGHHFGRPGGCGYDNGTIQIIEQVEVGNDN